MRSSDIRANIIARSEIEQSSTVEQNDETDTIATKKAKRQTRRLPDELAKQMLSSGQKHLFPVEVCLFIVFLMAQFLLQKILQ